MEPKVEIVHITTPVAKYTLDYNTGTIKAKPIITNADRIRAMSIEEMALFINFHTVCEECPVRDCKDAYTANPGACVRSIANWLKQEGE